MNVFLKKTKIIRYECHKKCKNLLPKYCFHQAQKIWENNLKISNISNYKVRENSTDRLCFTTLSQSLKIEYFIFSIKFLNPVFLYRRLLWTKTTDNSTKCIKVSGLLYFIVLDASDSVYFLTEAPE